MIVSGGDDNVFVVISVRIDSEGVKVVIIGSCLCVYLIEIIGMCNKWMLNIYIRNVKYI